MTIAKDRAHGLELVASLVARFRENEDHYRSASFDETSTRELFINPLMEALGWDVLDEHGAGPDRDVVFHPRHVHHGEAAGLDEWDEDLTPDEIAEREPVTQIPDYAFRLDGSLRFFLEAKRAGRPLATKAAVFQAKSYAWSQNARAALLTNFAELRLYETRRTPDINSPRTGQLLALGFADYETRWDDVWDLLSREAIESGSFKPKPRGTRGDRAVDDAFLEQLAAWRSLLAQDLYDHDPTLTPYELRENTQRILDRLVFVRVCEDRGVHPTVVLRPYSRMVGAYASLASEFQVLNAIYNGALFAQHASEQLTVSDHVIQTIIAELYFPFSPYRFDVLGVDVLGRAYERFLGDEVSIEGDQVVIQPKPEVQHAGGVYYTPDWVVNDIVSRVLAPLLEGKTHRVADNLRVLDPACGSGSFLLGVLEFLMAWYEDYFTASPTVLVDRHEPGSAGRRVLTHKARGEIVERSIFGVDIDAQAVEVAQMSLYLKILEGATSQSLNRQFALFAGTQYLPSLKNNIRCGNSLLEDADVPMELLGDQDLRRRINPFTWNDHQHGFGDVLSPKGKQVPGFSAVVGNPPYTRVQTLAAERDAERQLYEHKYATAVGSYDISTLFIERALPLLRRSVGGDTGGRLGFITTRTFCETDSGAELREKLSSGAQVEQIVDFGAGKVFGPRVSAYTLEIIATVGRNSTHRLVRVPSPPTAEALRSADSPGSATVDPAVPSSALSRDQWLLMLPREKALFDRLKTSYPSLKDVSGDSIFQGVTTGADPIYRMVDRGLDPNNPGLRRVVPRKNGDDGAEVLIEEDLLRPIFQGATDIQPFRVKPVTEYLLMPYARDKDDHYRPIPSRQLAQSHPFAYAWLLSQKSVLTRRAFPGKGAWDEDNWTMYSARKNMELYEEAKVMVPYMAAQLAATYDSGGTFFVNVSTGGNGVAIDPNHDVSIKYLAALLNTQTLTWVLQRVGRAFQGEYAGARKGSLVHLPIAIPDASSQQAIQDAFDRCAETASMLDASTPNTADHDQLDRMHSSAVSSFEDQVMDLYGLDPGEREVVANLLDADPLVAD